MSVENPIAPIERIAARKGSLGEGMDIAHAARQTAAHDWCMVLFGPFGTDCFPSRRRHARGGTSAHPFANLHLDD